MKNLFNYMIIIYLKILIKIVKLDNLKNKWD